jgi:mono/diheme cytochrome c family protein
MIKSIHKLVATAAAAFVVGAMPAMAEVPAKPTFTKDVLPILQENCQTCHRPAGTNLSGMIAPMSLITYQEVRPWAKAISKAVDNKQMPPWHANEKTHGVFANERTLTQDEIATIVKWVEMRAPRGNPADAPEPMEFSNTGWNFGEPDLVVDFPEPFFVPDDIQDLYKNITTEITEEQMPSDRWIRSIEFKPGSEVVHHIIGHANSKNNAGDETRGMLGGNAPGADQSEFPDGFGIQLHKGSHITFAMHYHKESGAGTGMYDSSQIGFQFHDEGAEVTHPIEISTISHGAFTIPPHHKKWKVGSSRTFHEDTLLLNMLPHMHLRGTEAIYTAFYPDGSSEQLLHVPAYDFNWQTGYDYEIMKDIPAGTRIEMEFWFDNSETQAEKGGFNPARAISFGGPTTDEMDLAWITIAPKKEVSDD